MSRNSQTFPNPDAFNPDRYFNHDGTWNADVLDPTAFAFGFGRRCTCSLLMLMGPVAHLKPFRRVCPGRHFAIASIYIYAASILHVFNISPKRDTSGKPIEIQRDMVSGVVTCVPRCLVWCGELIEFVGTQRDSNATSSLVPPTRRLSYVSVGRRGNGVVREQETIRIRQCRGALKSDLYLYALFTTGRD